MCIRDRRDVPALRPRRTAGEGDRAGIDGAPGAAAGSTGGAGSFTPLTLAASGLGGISVGAALF